MTSEDRQELAKQVASMVLLQLFHPLEQQHRALTMVLEKLEAHTAALHELVTVLREDTALPPQQAKPRLGVAPMRRPSDGEGTAD
jgi:hypothetical protein